MCIYGYASLSHTCGVYELSSRFTDLAKSYNFPSLFQSSSTCTRFHFKLFAMGTQVTPALSLIDTKHHPLQTHNAKHTYSLSFRYNSYGVNIKCHETNATFYSNKYHNTADR